VTESGGLGADAKGTILNLMSSSISCHLKLGLLPRFELGIKFDTFLPTMLPLRRSTIAVWKDV